jgi:SagB-type dehydrogenase family enzyme
LSQRPDDISENTFTCTIAGVTQSLLKSGTSGSFSLEDFTPSWLDSVSIAKVVAENGYSEWGRGLTWDIAALGAVMERVERISAIEAAKHAQLRRGSLGTSASNTLGLGDLGLCNFQRFLGIDTQEPTLLNSFAPLKRYSDNEAYFAPASRIFLRYTDGIKDYICSTGLASHFDRDKAIERGVLEILERHAHHVMLFNAPTSVRLVDIYDTHLGASFLCKRLYNAGFELCVTYSDMYPCLHTVIVMLSHPDDHQGMVRQSKWHCGVHWNLGYALERTLTEMIVSRCASGWQPRSLTSQTSARRSDTYVHTDDTCLSLATLPEFTGSHVDALNTIAAKYGTNIFWADLTHPAIGLPAVRVLIPGLQPNFDLLGRTPSDWRSIVTPHINVYDEVIRNIAAGRFHQQSVYELSPTDIAGKQHGSPRTRAKANYVKVPPCVLRYDGEYERFTLGDGAGTLGVLIGARHTSRDVGRPIAIESLGQLLANAVGYRGMHFSPTYGVYTKRNYPSPGSRHSLELFVEAYAVRGLGRGVYHYSPDLNGTCRLRGDDIGSGYVDPTLNGIPACLLYMFSCRDRLRCKYPGSVRRFGLLEAGHLGQNITLMAEQLSFNVVPLGAQIGHRVAKYVPLGDDYAFTYAMAIGSR